MIATELTRNPFYPPEQRIATPISDELRTRYPGQPLEAAAIVELTGRNYAPMEAFLLEAADQRLDCFAISDTVIKAASDDINDRLRAVLHPKVRREYLYPDKAQAWAAATSTVLHLAALNGIFRDFVYWARAKELVEGETAVSGLKKLIEYRRQFVEAQPLKPAAMVGDVKAQWQFPDTRDSAEVLEEKNVLGLEMVTDLTDLAVLHFLRYRQA